MLTCGHGGIYFLRILVAMLGGWEELEQEYIVKLAYATIHAWARVPSEDSPGSHPPPNELPRSLKGSGNITVT
jgi:hypothetical protein